MKQSLYRSPTQRTKLKAPKNCPADALSLLVARNSDLLQYSFLKDSIVTAFRCFVYCIWWVRRSRFKIKCVIDVESRTYENRIFKTETQYRKIIPIYLWIHEAHHKWKCEPQPTIMRLELQFTHCHLSRGRYWDLVRTFWSFHGGPGNWTPPVCLPPTFVDDSTRLPCEWLDDIVTLRKAFLTRSRD